LQFVTPVDDHWRQTRHDQPLQLSPGRSPAFLAAGRSR
jgi:hypothetical protein